MVRENLIQCAIYDNTFSAAHLEIMVPSDVYLGFLPVDLWRPYPAGMLYRQRIRWYPSPWNLATTA